jgi:hypothetical protein
MNPNKRILARNVVCAFRKLYEHAKNNNETWLAMMIISEATALGFPAAYITERRKDIIPIFNLKMQKENGDDEQLILPIDDLNTTN